MLPLRTIGLGLSLGLALASPAYAESSFGLHLDAPDACATDAQLTPLLRHAGTPPGVHHAVLHILRTGEGYEAIFDLNLEQSGTHLSDTQQTETCAAALAWGAFNWNNMFPSQLPSPPRQATAPAPPPQLELQLALGGEVVVGFDGRHSSSSDWGGNAELSAAYQHFRLGVLGSAFAPKPSKDYLQRKVTMHRQRVGAQACGMLGDKVQVGVCGIAVLNFLQSNVEATTHSPGRSPTWADLGAAVLAGVRLPMGFLMEARVSATVSTLGSELSNVLGSPPLISYVLVPTLSLGYRFDLTLGAPGSADSVAASTPPAQWVAGG
jgi:hypothetical protein